MIFVGLGALLIVFVCFRDFAVCLSLVIKFYLLVDIAVVWCC